MSITVRHRITARLRLGINGRGRVWAARVRFCGWSGQAARARLCVWTTAWTAWWGPLPR